MEKKDMDQFMEVIDIENRIKACALDPIAKYKLPKSIVNDLKKLFTNPVPLDDVKHLRLAIEETYGAANQLSGNAYKARIMILDQMDREEWLFMKRKDRFIIFTSLIGLGVVLVVVLSQIIPR